MAKRAICPVCQRDVALKGDGTFMKHGQHRVGNAPAAPRAGTPCAGMRPPCKENETDADVYVSVLPAGWKPTA